MTKKSHTGFTLIEIMLVVGIMAILATMVISRVGRYYDPPMSALSRTVTEILDLALDGIPVRLRMDVLEKSDRGMLVTEALVKVPESAGVASGLEWRPIQMRHPLTGEGWRIEPGIIYFYTDGTCTPAKIWHADRDTRTKEGLSALLTVTGYIFEQKK